MEQYRISYPVKVFVLIWLFEKNQISNITEDKQDGFYQAVCDFLRMLESMKKDAETITKQEVMNTIEGITEIKNHLEIIWTITPKMALIQTV